MIYVLTRIKEWNGGYTDPEVMGATTSKELADRWGATSSYIHGDLHRIFTFYDGDDEKLIRAAEALEKKRAEEYEKQSVVVK